MSHGCQNVSRGSYLYSRQENDQDSVGDALYVTEVIEWNIAFASQLLTRNILRVLPENLPENAFCVIATTMRDLYPGRSWNFVFGEASLRDRVGVYSFARYDPQFYGLNTSNRDYLILRRSCKVLAHETSHMFGIQHCIYFNCLMNGSNHLEESDRRPLHLCPVDLRKLHYSIGFDIGQRCRNLLDFFKAVRFNDEVQWLERRLSRAA